MIERSWKQFKQRHSHEIKCKLFHVNQSWLNSKREEHKDGYMETEAKSEERS